MSVYFVNSHCIPLLMDAMLDFLYRICDQSASNGQRACIVLIPYSLTYSASCDFLFKCAVYKYTYLLTYLLIHGNAF